VAGYQTATFEDHWYSAMGSVTAVTRSLIVTKVRKNPVGLLCRNGTDTIANPIGPCWMREVSFIGGAAPAAVTEPVRWK
jgi:hypothetical protein